MHTGIRFYDFIRSQFIRFGFSFDTAQQLIQIFLEFILPKKNE